MPEPARAENDSGHRILEPDEEEDGDCCRICRCGATADDGLFYPCKCSGSIKYVHQQCLIDWLSHSGNTHCEVCKHKFSFTPVYAKDAPSRLPWHELAVGLLKRAAAGVRVAHRVWLVSCVWLILVPWITCLAWRLAFLRRLDEVPKLLIERCNVLAVATDCIQGSMLSIAIVFLNIAVSSLKDHLKTAMNSLEQQIVREVAAPQTAAAPAVVAVLEPPPAAAAAVEAPALAVVEGHGLDQAVVEQNAQPAQQQQEVQQDEPQQLGGLQEAPVAAAAAPAAPAAPPAAGGGGGEGLAAAMAAAEAIIGDGVGVIDADDAAVGAAAPDDEDWGDVPFEELLGLQGPWLNFLGTIALVIVGNTFFMAGAVYLPLNIGRLLLTAARNACSNLTLEQQQLLQQVVAQHVQHVPFAADTVKYVLGLLAPAVVSDAMGVSGIVSVTAAAAGTEGNATSILAAVGDVVNATAAALANTTAAAANSTALAAAGQAALAPALDPAAAAAISPAPFTLEQVMKEIHAQLELPARADFVALSLGHCLLGSVLLLVLWMYMTVRLWRAARRRMRRTGRRPVVQVLRSTGRWLLAAASTVSKGVKLTLLLTLELGMFPLAAGLWLDICALPLTSTSIEQRSELFAKTPFMAGFMHWALGLGFLLGFTFMVCVVREVLRPGALPFLKDPTNPERNPIREMLQEPLLRQLGRVLQSWVVHAGLCVVLVHLPALLARALLPSMYPLRVTLFDPLTQVPADMLLLHILLPFTVEHVKVKGAVKAGVQCWLRFAGRLLDWSEYLLPASELRRQAPLPVAAPIPAAPPPAAAPAEPATGASDVQQEQQAEQPRPNAAAAPMVTTEPDLVAGSSSSAVSAAAASVDHVGRNSASHNEAEHSYELANEQQQQQQQQQPPQQQVVQQQQPFHLPQMPVTYYERQPGYNTKLLALVLLWLGTLVIINLLIITVPVALGRGLFSVLGLPFKNDVFTGAIGLLVLWGGYSLAAGVAASANLSGAKAVVAAAWKWLVLAGQWLLLLVLWLGVVATMMGMLCELVLLPLRLPPNQTALIYLYQDWTMGVLALKLMHLLVMVTPRREGRPPPDPDSIQAHFEALQQGGLRNLDFNRAVTKIVMPVMMHLATCLAVPFVVSRGVLPLMGLPAQALQYANLYAYQIFYGMVLLYKGSRRLHQWALQLHNTIRDDKYLVGRQLNNFELQQRQEREQEQQRQQQQQQQRAEEEQTRLVSEQQQQQQQLEQQQEGQLVDGGGI